MDGALAGDADSLAERLARVVGELWSIAEQIGDAGVIVDGGEAANEVHSVTSAAAHAVRSLAGRYALNAGELFDEQRGAEHDAADLVLVAERNLRLFAEDLQKVADRHARLIAELDRLTDRAIYELAFDDLDDEEEYFAVVEVSYAKASDEILRAYAREDVARYHAQRFARRGTPGNAYRVVPVRKGEPEPHVAEWPGEGDVDV